MTNVEVTGLPLKQETICYIV